MDIRSQFEQIVGMLFASTLKISFDFSWSSVNLAYDYARESFQTLYSNLPPPVAVLLSISSSSKTKIHFLHLF